MSSDSEMTPIELEIYPEICCDQCNEVIHNHIDCPVCKKGYASTDAYGDIPNTIDDYCNNEMKCECGAIFVLVDREYPYKWVIKQ